MFGLTEAEKRTGIPARTIRGWAKRAGLDLTTRSDGNLPSLPVLEAQIRALDWSGQPPAQSGEIARTNARAKEGETPGEIAQTGGDILDVDARLRLKRQLIRKDLLDKIHDALNRMDEQHIEFFPVRDAVIQEIYPKAPAVAFRAYAQAFATLFKEYRLEVGEATDRPETTQRILDEVKGDKEREALKRAIELGISLKAAAEESKEGNR